MLGVRWESKDKSQDDANARGSSELYMQQVEEAPNCCLTCTLRRAQENQIAPENFVRPSDRVSTNIHGSCAVYNHSTSHTPVSAYPRYH